MDTQYCQSSVSVGPNVDQVHFILIVFRYLLLLPLSLTMPSSIPSFQFTAATATMTAPLRRKRASPMIAAVSLFAVCLFVTAPVVEVQAQQAQIALSPGPYSCNICRDPPAGTAGTRELINHDKAFTMANGNYWTCGYLQETVQDLQPVGGAPGEATLCATTQYLAWQYCDCFGVEIPGPLDTYKEPNPACDLCGSGTNMFSYVPDVNYEKTTNTQVMGVHNCLGLYQAMAQGVLSSNLCPTVQAASGLDCCNIWLG